MKGTNPSPRRRGRSYYAGYLRHYTRKNTLLLALAGVFLAGVLLGAFTMQTAGEETRQLLFQLTGGYVERRQAAALAQNFLAALGPPMLFLGVLFVCGFCAVSQPVEVFALLFRGLGFGLTTASLYAGYGMAAVGFVALFILPGMVVTTLVMLVCCRESLRLSGSFLAAMRRQEKDFYSIQAYTARFLAAAVLCVLSALLEAVLLFLFAGFFAL